MFKEEVFTTIPKHLLNEKDINDIMLLILPYLRIKSSLQGEIGTTLEEIIRSIGYIPNNNEERINKKVLNCLIWLIEKKYIFINMAIEKITEKIFIKIIINKHNNIFNIEDEQGKYIPYVLLTSVEYFKILQSSIKISKGILLRVFLNIKKYIDLKKDDNYCFPSQKTIKNDCGKNSNETITKAITELEKIGLIYVYKPEIYNINNGIIKHSNNIYSLNPISIEKLNHIYNINHSQTN